MKANTSIKTIAAIASSLLCVAAFSTSLANNLHRAEPAAAAAAPVPAAVVLAPALGNPDTYLQTVTVTARRPVQTIVVTAKRLSDEEKAQDSAS
ncbi:MAG TPA: hypothetical protein VIT92_08715 [Burkholderiaceae bacterium]